MRQLDGESVLAGTVCSDRVPVEIFHGPAHHILPTPRPLAPSFCSESKPGVQASSNPSASFKFIFQHTGGLGQEQVSTSSATVIPTSRSHGFVVRPAVRFDPCPVYWPQRSCGVSSPWQTALHQMRNGSARSATGTMISVSSPLIQVTCLKLAARSRTTTACGRCLHGMEPCAHDPAQVTAAFHGLLVSCKARHSGGGVVTRSRRNSSSRPGSRPTLPLSASNRQPGQIDPDHISNRTSMAGV